MVQAFDADDLQLTGDPISLEQDVNYMPGLGRGRFSVSKAGVLSYATGASGHQPAWFDRNGKWIEDVGDPEIRCTHVSLSPDENRVALQCFAAEGGSTDIWVADLSRRGTFSRLTSNPGWDMNPIWSPDGKRLIFRCDDALFEKASTGAGKERKLLDLGGFRPTDWSPNGDSILYQSDETGAESDLFLLSTSGSGQPETLIQTPFSEVDGHFSPDGKWIAYASNETGQFEIYVQSFPGGGPKQQISTGGGRHPRWRQDTRELYYIANDGNLMAVPLAKVGTALEVGDPQPLFRPGMVAGWLSYAVASDGQRFLIPSTPERTTASSVAVVLNWAAELEQ
jgi:dipeptidyl aminopeptidase/acylaminoacyl peptidase